MLRVRNIDGLRTRSAGRSHYDRKGTRLRRKPPAATH